MRRLSLLLVLLLAGCGGGGGHSTSSTSTSRVLTPAPNGGVVRIPGPGPAKQVPVQQTRPVPTLVSQKCPVGQAQMGCSQQAVLSLHRGPGLAIPPVPLFPDVSVWQGAVNWSSVAAWQRSHGWHPIAVWKMGEFHIDTQARRNASETTRLGFYRVGYWFVRNTGCATEAGQIVAEAHAEALKVVVEDTEVPEARGYAACLTPRLRSAGLVAVQYTSPGSNPDASNPGVPFEWVAAYGPQHVPCLWVCSVGQLDRQTIVAWQLTDGRFGFVTDITGIGKADVSADYGLGKVVQATLTPAPKPPTPPKPPPAPTPKPSADPYHYGVLTAAELDRVLPYDFARRDPARYAGYLRHLQADLRVLADQVWKAAHTGSSVSWAVRHRGTRFQVLSARAQGKQVAK